MNQYAIDGLRVKLAEINAAIRTSEQRLRTLALDKDTITRALAIMGVETSEGAVSLGIASGAFSRTILEVIRDAGEPIGVRGIADVLAKRLEAHSFKENAASIANKLARGTFTATFFLATLAALEMEGLRLEDL